MKLAVYLDSSFPLYTLSLVKHDLNIMKEHCVITSLMTLINHLMFLGIHCFICKMGNRVRQHLRIMWFLYRYRSWDSNGFNYTQRVRASGILPAGDPWLSDSMLSLLPFRSCNFRILPYEVRETFFSPWRNAVWALGENQKFSAVMSLFVALDARWGQRIHRVLCKIKMLTPHTKMAKRPLVTLSHSFRHKGKFRITRVGVLHIFSHATENKCFYFTELNYIWMVKTSLSGFVLQIMWNII